MRIFVQNQGMREILPQAYIQYSEDKILSITPRLGKKTILQEAPRNTLKQKKRINPYVSESLTGEG